MKNSNPMIHNIRSFSIMIRAFNIAPPPDTPDRKKVFTAAEKAVKIACDIHPWMAGYYFVMEHPYFTVTDKKGRIRDLPKGAFSFTFKAGSKTPGRVLGPDTW